MIGEDLLITIDDWCIYRLAKYGTGICHISCGSWMRKSAKGCECTYCHNPIPDDIYGLWVLHNFDDMGEL